MRIGILPDDKRDITSEQLVLKMRPELNNFLKEKFSNLDIKLKLIEDPPGPPVLSTLLVRIQGFDEKRIMEEAKKLMPEIAKVEGVVDLDMSLSVDTKTLQVVVDHYAASKAKVTPAQIVGTLNSLYSGKVLGIFHQQNNAEQELIKLRFSKDVRLDASTLEAITIPNPMRISIPLSKLVKVQEVETQKPLYKENHIPTVYIYGEMGDRSITYAGIDILTKLYDYKLANGKGAKDKFSLYGIDYKTEDMKDVRISLGGEWELTLDVFRDLMIAMAMAVLVIYLVLVAQFESFSDPLIIMSTIPLGVIGVMPGFMILNVINGEYFTATSMIGVIALAGIAVNNSIILLEYLNSLRGKQIPMVEALVEACGTRLRPIALTTVTTMLGSMTILDDPVWSGLAWAIILGLGMSSALILIVFPALYAIVREKEWNKHHK